MLIAGCFFVLILGAVGLLVLLGGSMLNDSATSLAEAETERVVTCETVASSGETR
jgi:hypothetical protein